MGTILRPTPTLLGGFIDTRCSKRSVFPASVRFPKSPDFSKASLKSRNSLEVTNYGINAKKEAVVVVKEKVKKGKKLERDVVKKKLKFVKELSRNLLRFFDMVADREGSGKDDHGKTILEATMIILAQLQQLKIEDNKIKRKIKEEKLQLEATPGEICCPGVESSDIDGEHVLETGVSTNISVTSSPSVPAGQNMSYGIEVPTKVSLTNTGSLLLNQNVLDGVEICYSAGSSGDIYTERIEVCTGPKCKKYGGEELLEKLKTEHGTNVVGCKCMGKCRNAPNVRMVSNDTKKYLDSSTLLLN
ncbi:hypothetical protein GIB67_029845 [Kingdonia uniflora]|uniref:Uncharacterized protein n=1 Tax=Kingdonia uniflora TaxID=39325 RepID=A0A7J7NJ56_9MAGN|nr:hypothetical protein GIB67_029845 [Kingdonia uniflora]